MDLPASSAPAVTVTASKAPLNWPAVVMFAVTTVPVFAVLPWFLVTQEVNGWSWVWALVLLWLNGLGITAGYHRLWAHRTYTAHPALKWFLALFGGMAVQNSILVWGAMHRVHHKHVDHVDHDPYSAKRGFWYSHMGWMLRDYPSAQLDYSNAKDLLADPVVAFQHKHYLWFAFGSNVAIPVALGFAYGDVWSFVLIAGFLRLVVNHHVTFFINSLAHMWGRQPYTTTNTARDNDFIALLTYGEGYHNYHHLFQYDYRNGIRWWHFDPTKWLIAGCSWIGLSRDLKRVPNFKIKRAMLQAQFERARARLALANHHPSRLTELQHLLETEWQQFSHTVAEWSKLQGEKLDAAKLHMAERVHEAQHHLQERWETSEMRQKVLTLEKALEEALEMQRQRVSLLRMQMATA